MLGFVILTMVIVFMASLIELNYYRKSKDMKEFKFNMFVYGIIFFFQLFAILFEVL